jgi:hypothetical protein
MTTWTQAAKTELENYFQRIRPGLAATGADPDEVMEDLRRHLDAEIATAQLSVVAEQDVRRLLARIGAPEAPPPTSPLPPPTPAVPTGTSKPMGPFVSSWLLFLGVLLPAATLVIEAATGMCAGAFFDPVPTFWHVLLVAFVPFANGWVWLALRNEDSRRRDLLGWLNGAAIAIATFYSFLYFPLLLPGLFALVFFGWGLLPLSPLISLIVAVALRRRLRRLAGSEASLPGFWRGLAVGLLTLLLVEAPVTLTRVGTHWAASESRSTELAGLRLLRTLGREEQMLRDCYGYTRGAQNMDLLGSLISGGERVPPEQARQIFYRVTGQPFNAVPAPVVRTGRGVFGDLNNWTWDDDHGGDKVGGRIRGLSLFGSRLDTIVHPGAAWSYTEWTLEFRNDSDQAREARAQILLPPGGVVSRLTLWVNGEEREAAFAGRSQVREAYREVAVVKRRDPVLVTTAGPDRVLMQCFPVPAGGGTMKVRLGITAPLLLDSPGEGLVRLPAFLERNFSLREGFTHSFWADGGEVKSTNPKLVPSLNAAGKPALHGQLSNAELASPAGLVRVNRDPKVRHAWTADTRAGAGHFIRQSIGEEPAAPPRKLIVVVDGSREMRPFLPSLAAALRQLPAAIPLTVLIADDDVVTLGGTNRAGGGDPLAGLAAWRATGGQDNVPALIHAQELAAREPGSAMLWIHGPQPALFAPMEPLLQAWQRNAAAAPLYEIQTAPGPDRVVEQLDGQAAVHSLPRRGSLESDLQSLFVGWQAGQRLVMRRESVDTESAARADAAMEGTLHLARLWANDEVRRLTAHRQASEAAQQAARYQLVTPVSGAVVLENQQQFTAAGLQPVDPQSVPSIPEPSTAAVFLLGGALLLLARRRKLGN